MGVFVDSSQDILHLRLTYDSSSDNFYMNATRIAGGFKNPVDAVLDSNILYVIEFGFPNSSFVPGLYAVTLPTVCSTCSPPLNDSCFEAQDLGLDLGAAGCVQDTVVITGSLECSSLESTGTCSSSLYGGDVWYRFFSQGRPFYLTSTQTVGVSLFSGTSCNALSVDTCVNSLSAGDTVRIHDPSTGNHYLRISGDSSASATAFELSFIFESLSLDITDTSTTSCSTCFDGSIIFAAEGIANSYSVALSPDTGILSGNTIYDLPAGFYVLCIIDSSGCTVCDSATVDFNTEVTNIALKNMLRVFPNPNNGRFSITTENRIGETLRLTDAAGRIVFTEVITADEIVIDASKLQPGSYILNIGKNKLITSVIISR
jgi:hypothetical protein